LNKSQPNSKACDGLVYPKNSVPTELQTLPTGVK